MEKITAYYDRVNGSIAGSFTIQLTLDDNKIKKLFERVPSRSGQHGIDPKTGKLYAETSWERGKSPIPYGTWRLWTSCINVGAAPGRTGIGEAFYISSGDDKITLTDGKSIRREIMLHAENARPGSAGCIVIVSLEEFRKISAYLKGLNKLGMEYITLKVL